MQRQVAGQASQAWVPVQLRRRPVSLGLSAARCVSAEATRSSEATEAPKRPSLLDFAWSAQKDVEGMLSPLGTDGPWVRRLHRFSELALELWPRNSAHWRAAGPRLIPPLSKDSMVNALQKSGMEGEELSAVDRATLLRGLASFRASPEIQRRITPLMSMLVEAGGSGGLAAKLPVEELLPCILALSQSSTLPLPDSPVRDFVRAAARRCQQHTDSIALKDLYALREALHRCGLDSPGVDKWLRGRLESISVADQIAADVPSVAASAGALGQPAMLRSPGVRQALLPDVLKAGVAAELLPAAMPAEGAPSSAHEFVVAMAVGSIAASPKSLTAAHVGDALRGVQQLQASADPLSIEHAGRVLRTVWPRLPSKLPHFGPEELSLALQSYCWQLQYSLQETAATGVSRDHPTKASLGTSSGRNAAREEQATKELKAKLVWPVLERLGEMPLKQISACLSAVCPAVRPPNILSDEERLDLKELLNAVFPDDEPGKAAGGKRWEDFKQDFWAGELHSLTHLELLDLACGLREFGGGAPWVLESVLSELEQRLRPPRKSRPAVELSHFTLLRLCRVMDIWQGHAVEEMLTHLLTNPESVKPLPTPYFVAMVSSLCNFLVPKDVPLRLVASFLDMVDAGERQVKPEHWLDILCAIRPLDEPPSWERATPRIMQHLVPHIGALSPPDLLTFLATIASKPYDVGHAGGGGDSALERMPRAATEAARVAVETGAWDFEQVVSAFESLGKLDWYNEAALGAMLANFARTPLLEPHAPLLLPMSQACVSLRVHHAPLLHKMVQWYCWCYTYLRPKPLPAEHLDELLEFASNLLELSFQSLELHAVLAENLRNPNASARQVLALLAALARFSHFPPEFKESCARVCAESSDSDLVALSSTDLVNAFNIHLCAVFDGPAALKQWLTEDEAMKAFFQVHTSQKWYQKQDQERTTFLQSSAYLGLRQAMQAEGLDLQPSDPGEVYHMEFVSPDAKERLHAQSPNPPIALLCIKSKEQLRWYVPITADGAMGEAPMENRCQQFRYMFRGSVQKMRHLQAMGYRTAVVWMSEWTELPSEEAQREYLRTALGAPGPLSTAFSPSPSFEESAYS